MTLSLKPFTSRGCRRTLLAACLASLLIVLTGCDRSERYIPERISQEPHASGNEQAAPAGAALPKPLRVLVEGPRIPGLLGGKGSRSSVKGIPVTFTVVNAKMGAVFTENEQPSYTVETDTAGIAAAPLRLGAYPGDITVRATIETPGGTKSVDFRAISGVELLHAKFEGRVGQTFEDVGLRLTDGSGQPAVGVPVYFKTSGSELGDALVLTDEDGRAVTTWKMDAKASTYQTTIDIHDTRTGISEAQRFTVRSIQIEALALDTRRMAIFLFGGLAIFIFGMKLMSTGLQRMADHRLKSILQAMTRNTVLAVIVGAGLTALVQSSSATTVMTVGFINAGLMTLKQAVGVIFGANIGTTITAQMIAFKLTSLAYPSIVLGLVLSMVPKRPRLQHFGEAVLGFGLLFLGMMTMSDVLKPLRHSQEFYELFQLYDCTPIDGIVPWRAVFMCIVIGSVVTVIVQSSSASIGLVLALCGQGLIPFYTAFPLILGTNTGTTITAILASLGANRNAKRAALAHTLFNVFGAAYMFALLFLPLWDGQPVFLGLIDAVTPGDVFNETPENLPRHVANAHTAFNILNCIIFIPFVMVMVKFCQWVIPMKDSEGESALEYLEPHLLNTPSLALEQAVKEVTYMLRRAQKNINDGCDFFCGGPPSLAEKIAEREDIIDNLQTEITTYLVQLSQHPLSASEYALIPALIHAVNDVERIGDHSENMAELTQLKLRHKRTISKKAEEEIRQAQDLINRQCHAVYRMLENDDPAELEEVNAKESTIARLMVQASDSHVARLKAGECEVQAGVLFLDFMGSLERVGDHLVNIAERTAEWIQTKGTGASRG